jgi:hypothetical protein
LPPVVKAFAPLRFASEPGPVTKRAWASCPPVVTATPFNDVDAPFWVTAPLAPRPAVVIEPPVIVVTPPVDVMTPYMAGPWVEIDAFVNFATPPDAKAPNGPL